MDWALIADRLFAAYVVGSYAAVGWLLKSGRLFAGDAFDDGFLCLACRGYFFALSPIVAGPGCLSVAVGWLLSPPRPRAVTRPPAPR